MDARLYGTPLHEQEVVRSGMTDKIMFMDKGVVELTGTPDEVFEAEHNRMQEFLGKFQR